MDKEKIATSRTYKYLSLLQDKNSKSYKAYEDLINYLKKGHVEGKVTMADLLLTAFSQLGYMCKSKPTDLDSKEPEMGQNGKPIVHEGKYNKFAAFFDEIAGKTKLRKFYGESKQNEDWCAVFVHWCMFNTIGEKNTRIATNISGVRKHGAGVDYDFDYYMEFPHSISMFLHKGASFGDQAFFYTKDGLVHTGLVVANYGGYIYVIEGNTNPQVGKGAKAVPTGKGVCLKRYSVDRIDIEYCRPYYKEIAPFPDGFSAAELRKKIANLYEVLKAELEQNLTPEELVEDEVYTPDEIEKTKLQILKKKMAVINKTVKSIGKDFAKSYGNDLRDLVSTGFNLIATQISSIGNFAKGEDVKRGKK